MQASKAGRHGLTACSRGRLAVFQPQLALVARTGASIERLQGRGAAPGARLS